MKRTVLAFIFLLAITSWGWSADTVTISEYFATTPEVTSTTSTDAIPIVTGVGTTPTMKHITPSNLSIALGGGTVTSVTADAPLSSSGGTTPNLTCATASGSTTGCLSSADWTTFNNKQAAGSYVPTTRTVNSQALSGDITITAAMLGLTTPFTAAQVIDDTVTGSKCLHTSADGSKITLTADDCGGSGGGVTGVSATLPLSSSGGTSPDISCRTATGSVSGCISSTDWNTFNNKQASLGYTPENLANKGAANGYAALDASGKVAWANLSGVPTMPSGTIVGTSDSQVLSNKSFSTGMTWPTFNQNTTGTSAGLTAQYIDWSASSGGASIKNKPTLATVATTGAYSDLVGAPSATGVWLKTTVLTNTTSSTFTTQSGTVRIRVRGVGGGGPGGCTTGYSAQSAAAPGGGSGGYVEKWFTVTGSTGYTYVSGTAGTMAGDCRGSFSYSDGGNSTFTVGATTLTAGGGAYSANMAHGTAVTVVLGGTGGTATNGDVNIPGVAGQYGLRESASVAVSGAGGSSLLGAGGRAKSSAGTGIAGTGYGAGGSGSVSVGAGDYLGGSGSQGVWIVEEFGTP